MNEHTHDNEQAWPQLNAMKEQVEQLAIPPEIDEAIRQGIRAGRALRRRRMRTRMASYAACLLLIVMMATIRFSPTVAAYVGDIPGLRSLVQFIHYDKGLRLALENDFMQPVGLSDEQDGIKWTVDGIVVDESRVIVFYSFDNVDGQPSVFDIQSVKLANIPNASASFGTSYFNEDWERRQGTIEFYIHDDTRIPERLDLELKTSKVTELNTNDLTWTLEIPVDTNKFEGQKTIYSINQTVTVEGQRITFGTMTVYPTRIGLEVEYDPTNTKKLFAFDDIRIEDESGETFGTINNGISASNVSDNRVILYFQSNYFRQPERLYLRASSIRALDKNKLEVQVDLERNELLARPDDKLTLNHVGNGLEDGKRVLDFGLKNDDPLDQHRTFSLFANTYRDASGRSFDSNRSGSSFDRYQLYIEDVEYLMPLILTVNDYPSRIRGDINVRVK